MIIAMQEYTYINCNAKKLEKCPQMQSHSI